MAEVKTKEYEIEIGGLTHTVLFSPEDAERYQAREKAAKAPQNKAVQSTPAK